MKTKQDQINEMVLAVPQTIVAYDANPKGQRLYGEQRQQIAETLYEAGYRKTPNDIREMIDVLYEGATLKEKLDEIKQLKNENKELKAKLEARLTCDLVKTAQEQAVQEFAEKLKSKTGTSFDYFMGFQKIVLAEQIGELLEEYKNE